MKKWKRICMKRVTVVSHTISSFITTLHFSFSDHVNQKHSRGLISESALYYTNAVIVVIVIVSVYLLPVFVLSGTSLVGRYVPLSSLMVDSVLHVSFCAAIFYSDVYLKHLSIS